MTKHQIDFLDDGRIQMKYDYNDGSIPINAKQNVAFTLEVAAWCREMIPLSKLTTGYDESLGNRSEKFYYYFYLQPSCIEDAMAFKLRWI